MRKTIRTAALLACALLGACGSIVEPPALCLGPVAAAASGANGREVGVAYNVVECDGVTFADTVRVGGR